MKTLKIKTGIGHHINEACKEAVELADKKKANIEFVFNEVTVTVAPGSNVEDVVAKWDSDREAKLQAWINSDEYKERERKNAEEYAAKCAAVMVESAKTEKEMREASVPWPQTEKQLMEYIESLVDRGHDYGTAVYAMSMAAVAAFYYVSHKVGASGFQASCADLDILRRTRSIEGPFLFLKGEDALYPQYDLPGELREAMSEWKPWLKEQAQKKLAETDFPAHPEVEAHWKKLANWEAV